MLVAVHTTLNNLERDFVSQEDGLNMLVKQKHELVRLNIGYNCGKLYYSH